jgi:hypothetical protein
MKKIGYFTLICTILIMSMASTATLVPAASNKTDIVETNGYPVDFERSPSLTLPVL